MCTQYSAKTCTSSLTLSHCVTLTHSALGTLICFFSIAVQHFGAFSARLASQCGCYYCYYHLLEPTCAPVAVSRGNYKLARVEKWGGGTWRVKKKIATALAVVSMVSLLTWQSALPFSILTRRNMDLTCLTLDSKRSKSSGWTTFRCQLSGTLRGGWLFCLASMRRAFHPGASLRQS